MVQSLARTATLIAAVAWNARSCVAAPVEPILESLAPSAVPTGSTDIGASSALQESTALDPSAVPTGSIDIGASSALQESTALDPSAVPTGSIDIGASNAPHQPKESGKPHPHECHPGPHSLKPHRSGMPSGIPKPSDKPVPYAAPSAAGSSPIPILPRQEDDTENASVSAAPSLGGPSATIPEPSGKPKGHHESHDCGEFPGHHSHEPHTGGPSSLKEPPHIPTPIPAGGASASAVPSSLPKRRNVMADDLD